MVGTRGRADELALALDQAARDRSGAEDDAKAAGVSRSAEVVALVPVAAALSAAGSALTSSAAAVTLPARLAGGREAMVAAATAHHAAVASAAAAGAGSAATAGSGLAAAGTKAGILKLGLLAMPGWIPVATGVAAVAVAAAGVVTTTQNSSTTKQTPAVAGPQQSFTLVPQGNAGTAPASAAAGAQAPVSGAPVVSGVPVAAAATPAAIMTDADQHLQNVAALLQADPTPSAATLNKIGTEIASWCVDVARATALLGTTRAGIQQLQAFVTTQAAAITSLVKLLPAATAQALTPVTTLIGQLGTAIRTYLSGAASTASSAVGAVTGGTGSLLTNLPLPLTLVPSTPAAITSVLPSVTAPKASSPAHVPVSVPAVTVTKVPVASIIPVLPSLPITIPLPVPAKTTAPAAGTATSPAAVVPSVVGGLASTITGAVTGPVSGVVGGVTGILGH